MSDGWLGGEFPSEVRYVPPPEPVWATWIPSRHPHEFKTHNTLGQAKNAMLQAYPRATGRAAIYRRKRNWWVMLGKYPHSHMSDKDARVLLREWTESA